MTKRTQQRKSNKHTPYAPLFEAVRQRTYDYMTTHNNSVPSTETLEIKELILREAERQGKIANGWPKTKPTSWERIEDWANQGIAAGVAWHDHDEEKDRRDEERRQYRQQQEQQYQQEQRQRQQKMQQRNQQHTAAANPPASGGFLSNLLGLLMLLLVIIVVVPAIFGLLSGLLGNIFHSIIYKGNVSLLDAVMGGIHYGIILAIVALVVLAIVDLGILIHQHDIKVSFANFRELFPGLCPLQVISAAFLLTFFIDTFFHVTIIFKVLLVILAYYTYVLYKRFLIHD